MIRPSRGALLERKPVDPGSIKPMHRRPAVKPFPYIGRYALLAREIDEVRNEAVITIAMNRRCKTNRRRAHSTLRQRDDRSFRNAWKRAGGGDRPIFLGPD